jgi:hypothetical protein
MLWLGIESGYTCYVLTSDGFREELRFARH